MRVLWVKAPLLLRRHPPVLAAVILMATLAALAAASLPLVRAGVESESLKGQLEQMTPLAAGIEVQTYDNPVAGDGRRRAAALELAGSLPFLTRPVMSSLAEVQVNGSAAPGLEVVALNRTGALAHVRHVTGGDPNGVWIADSTAQVTHLKPGDDLQLTTHVFVGAFDVVKLRVAGIYHALEADRDNPYWANWQQDIRALDPDSPVPPPFVLMSERDLQRVARVLSPAIENRFEYPIDPSRITYGGAKRLDARLTALGEELVRPGSELGRKLHCQPGNCHTTSSLSAALAIAATEVASVSPTISLLSGAGLVIALGLSVAAGLFLVRRRGDEAHVLFARGEATAAFGARTALECVLPAAVGLGLGLGISLLVLDALAPDGTVTHGTASNAAVHAALACAGAVVCVAAGAAAGFPRRSGGAPTWTGRLARVPWELAPLAVAALLLAVVENGNGVAQDASGANHPRLAVFVLPILAVAGVAGLVVRGLRAALARVGTGAPPAVFLALRRVGAARGLLVAVVVASAPAFGMFAYAATLSASLDRSTAEKAYVSNGSDVQGLIDPKSRVVDPLPFPVALVQVDQLNVSFASGGRVDLIAGDPGELARTLLWGKGWSDDPRQYLPRLGLTSDGALAAVATPGVSAGDAIVDQGKRIPIHVVGHAPVPGSTAGRPALLVSWPALRKVARRLHILEPAPQAGGLLWAKGPPKQLQPVLETSSIAPSYLTTLDHITDNVSVAAAERSYRYVKLIGLAAAVLSLVALLLYLHARQRSQLIASALVRRMGFGALGDAAALALEAAAVVLTAATVGAIVATAAARPIAHRVDSLPQYAPSPVLTVPWGTLTLGVACATAVAALLGAAAVALAARSNVAEALRVA